MVGLYFGKGLYTLLGGGMFFCDEVDLHTVLYLQGQWIFCVIVLGQILSIYFYKEVGIKKLVKKSVHEEIILFNEGVSLF